MMNYSIKIRFGTIVDMEKLLCMRKQVKLCGDSGEEAATARGLRRARRVTGKTNIDPNTTVFEHVVPLY